MHSFILWLYIDQGSKKVPYCRKLWQTLYKCVVVHHNRNKCLISVVLTNPGGTINDEMNIKCAEETLRRV